MPGGRKVSAKVWGTLEGSPDCGMRWIAVHGYLDNASSYDRLAPLMIERGLASAVLCLDLAGHGLSDFKETYHAIDYVPDVFFAADSVNWDTFSLLSHSLGGGVAQCAAACMPNRIARLVVIEALGWWSQEASAFPHTLATSLKASEARHRPNRPKSAPYSSLEECAQRRATMNLVGALPIDAARILVSRGAKEDPRGGFTWASDPELLIPSRFRLDEGSVQAYVSAIRSPMLLVFANDGLFRRFSVFGTPFTARWCLTVAAAYGIVYAVHTAAKIVGSKATDKIYGQMRPAFCFMVRWLHLKTSTTVMLGLGGHHPHLVRPEDVLQAMTGWVGGKGRIPSSIGKDPLLTNG
eukprot:CAMPEP_0173425492 /NCGR_PEP_ID=MMETSP1357-20121228/5194_1 /TAXON_ID=77926 /ORGANISM="Hemiselmis rufescens, Strain PCC563" /LENGTH=351 /DNA_ID=CAMNT_0014388947 /DNA_START=122 /DNA_END=1177 /DNA_ORIENTATION=-